MNKYKWLRLKEVDDLTIVRFKKGDFFLYGNRMKDQKNLKKIGDKISYYEVLQSTNEGKNIEYIQVFDVLTEDSLNERN